MKRKKNNLIILFALMAVSFAMLVAPASAQNGNSHQKTNSKMLYHDGPLMTDHTDVYFIWYGNWTSSTGPNSAETKMILTDFTSRLGGSSYFQINTTYPDRFGVAPDGALLYAGSINDVYSHGPSLTVTDIEEIVADSIRARYLPLDTTGIYIVFGSSDVTDIHPDGTSFKTFCTPSSPPHHGYVKYDGEVPIKYAFIGNAARCPTSAGPQFFAPDGSRLPTPNGNFAADAMASTLAHAISATITNPVGTAWYDRYGLENAAKCQGTFGQTYTTANGAQANLRFGTRHYLIQQNWVNVHRGYCGLSYP